MAVEAAYAQEACTLLEWARQATPAEIAAWDVPWVHPMDRHPVRLLV